MLDHDYLFSEIRKRISVYEEAHRGKRVLRLGIGDITRPLCPAAVDALCSASMEMGRPDAVKGYQPEPGAAFLREAVAADYAKKGVSVLPEEVFVNDGALPAIAGLFRLFHQVVFTNDLWLLDPQKDILVALMPRPFFSWYSGLLLRNLLPIVGVMVCLFVSWLRLGRKENPGERPEKEANE